MEPYSINRAKEGVGDEPAKLEYISAIMKEQYGVLISETAGFLLRLAFSM